MTETDAAREKRLRQRVLFDRVADLYDATRAGYPLEILDRMVTTAGIRAGSSILEIGCGTGQLTRQLARGGIELTAVDIGHAMVDAARTHVESATVAFEVVPFEDFDAGGRAFDLVVSATAFHWVDPDVAFAKAARVLRPGGWFALLTTGERYDEPLGPALLRMWIARSDDGGAWTRLKEPTDADRIAASGCFDVPVTHTHTERRTLSPDVVLGLEQTRATMLSYDDDVRAGFLAELVQLLQPLDEVTLDQVTTLTMAQVRD